VPTPVGAKGQSMMPTSDELDLLLVVDNSSSMADKQAVLATSVRRLLGALVNPACVDASGAFVTQPTSPVEACPGDSVRRFLPVRSMHLGVIDSSLGALGADQCRADDAQRDNDDKAHLLLRNDGGAVPTYLGEGYLAWDPDQRLSPGGELDFDSFVQHAVDLVVGAGQIGCGYEMPLESAYRFLVDPSPYASIEVSQAGAVPATQTVGLDVELLAEREHFLRPTSLVGVVVLSDEDDCSVRAGGQVFNVLDAAPFFRGSSTCATDPASACCYSCGLGPPVGCEVDALCSSAPKLSAPEDPVNLKCWHQKQRYGFSALYPVQRYVNAFSQSLIDPATPDLSIDPLSPPPTAVPNPLFADGRDPRLFVMTALVGIPWQAVARDPTDPASGSLDAAALDASGFWAREVGDPDAFVEPTDPLMTETYEKRPGVTSSSPNGGDRSIDTSAPTDLQYACIFPLPAPLPMGLDCKPGAEPDNPLCMGSVQIAAKAYPGLRELAVVHGLGAQGAVGSICAPATDPSVADPQSRAFGYNAGLDSMLDRLSTSLAR
jgi:hypothetical protein